MIHLVIVAVLVVLSTVALGLFLTNAPLTQIQASQQAGIVDNLMHIHWWFMAFFFSLIVVFILYSVIVFRRRKGERGDGVYMEGNKKLEILWTVIPIGIVLWFAVIGGKTLADVERRDPQAMTVNVYAAQWNWRFEYSLSSPDGVVTAVASNTLVLPKNRQVVLRLHSADVIHSFFVPEFRIKQDVLPGGEEFTRELRITPSVNGTYKVRCAEICGRGHWSMQAEVQVVDGSEFDAWLQQQSGACDLTDAECGQRWAQTYGCQACHSIDGTTIVGPTWKSLFGSEVTLADGSTVTADEDYIRNSILDPNSQVVQGFPSGVMPQNFADTLSEDQINQIIAFIKSLQ